MKNLCFVVLLITMLLTLGGCKVMQQGPLPSHVQVQVLDVPATVVDRLVPAEQRTLVEKSAYSVALVSRENTSSLVLQSVRNRALLLNETRDVNAWPGALQTSTYMSPEAPGFASGSLAGTVGVRNQWGKREVRLDYTLKYESPAMKDRPAINSHIAYAGQVSTNSIIFIAPYEGVDGQPRAHVVVFGVYAQ